MLSGTLCTDCPTDGYFSEVYKIYNNNNQLKGFLFKKITNYIPNESNDWLSGFEVRLTAVSDAWFVVEANAIAEGKDIRVLFENDPSVNIKRSNVFQNESDAVTFLNDNFSSSKSWLESQLGESIELV